VKGNFKNRLFQTLYLIGYFRDQ